MRMDRQLKLDHGKLMPFVESGQAVLNKLTPNNPEPAINV
jgi:hypothetical protein